MSRLFRQPGARLSSYGALILFATVYVAALALVIAPGQLVRKAAPAIEAVLLHNSG